MRAQLQAFRERVVFLFASLHRAHFAVTPNAPRVCSDGEIVETMRGADEAGLRATVASLAAA